MGKKRAPPRVQPRIVRAFLLAAVLVGRAVAAPSETPTVALTAPAAGAVLAGIVVLTATAASPTGIAAVQFQLDGVDLGSKINAAPYALSWNTAQAAGDTHLLTAVAWNVSGSSAVSTAVSVMVDNTPPVAGAVSAVGDVAPTLDTAAPTVVIMNPPAGASVSGVVMVSANALDNVGIASVQFMLDGVDLAPPLAAAPFLIDWKTTFAADGAHTLSASARDAAGNAATSAVVSVTVNNVPPVLSDPTLAGAAPNRVDILWTTDQRADSSVEYGPTPAYGQSTPVSTAHGTGHGVTVAGLAAGSLYHYRIKSRSVAGILSVSSDFTFATPADSPGAAALYAPPGSATATDTLARAPQKFLTPASADGVNDKAVFGPDAREATIFDLRGNQVFHGSSADPGAPIVWNCRDAGGRIVSSGVYLAKILTRGGRTIYQNFAVAK